MNPADKAKIDKLISKIEHSSFDENDVDLLFMKIRPYCNGFPIVREIADFVAHPDQRDKGITNCALEGFYLMFRYLEEFRFAEKSIDFTKPFPSYIAKLISYQLKKSDACEFRSKTGLSVSDFHSKFKNSILTNEKSETSIFKCRPDQRIFNSVNYLLSWLYGTAAYSGDQIFEQLIRVLQKNAIPINVDLIKAQSKKIIICTLLLIHNTTYNFKGYKAGSCKISCEKTSIVLIPSGLNIPGIESVPVEEHGNLRISGLVKYLHGNEERSVAFHVIDTNLKAIEWCSSKMITKRSIGATVLTQQIINFDGIFCLEEEFKLSKIEICPETISNNETAANMNTRP